MWTVYWEVEISMIVTLIKEVRTFKSGCTAADFFMRTNFGSEIDGTEVDWSRRTQTTGRRMQTIIRLNDRFFPMFPLALVLAHGLGDQ